MHRKDSKETNNQGTADLLLGIDVGTSSVKGLVCDTAGHVVVQATEEHPLHAPRPGWAEESPADWWANVVAVIQACLADPRVSPHRIAAIGTTGMVPTVMLLDADGEPLRPSIQQNDARATREIEQLRTTLDPQTFFKMTGASLSQQSVSPKLRWLQRHEPEIWAQTHHILGSYSYVAAQLTGTITTEINWALESGLYDLTTEQWAPILLESAHVPTELLPPIQRPTDIIGTVTRRAAKQTGLAMGTPVVAGTADHVGAALAAGIRADGDLLVKYGSAGDILYSTETLILDPRLYIDYHDVPGTYLLNGCMASSGSLVRWFTQQFCEEDVGPATAAGQSIYAYLDDRAATLPAGSEGVVVLPYFLGEKTPVLDPQARGVIFGLTLFHSRYHIYRAVLEAVAFGFRHHMEVLEENGCRVGRVVAGGNGARSRLWRQITADVLNCPIASLAAHPGAALAAAFVAGMGVGAFREWGEIERFVTLEEIVDPNPTHRAVYDEHFEIYRELYDRLKSTFRRIPASRT
jgi:xylulokinase